MQQRTTRRAITLLAAGAVLALAGCGDDAGDPGTLTDTEFLGHQLREVAADEAPSLEFDIEADDHGGWNIHINADGFEFTPEDLNGDAVAGQGHAHVYVDDTKFSRVYDEWFYLPASAVGEGEHTVLITLNADDHSAWAVDGEAITASTTVTGEAGAGSGEHEHGEDMDPDGDSATDPAKESDPDEEAVAADHVFSFTVADGTADPQLEQHRIEQGSTVRIEVTSDVADELHLHGYDVSADVAAGETAVLEFTADMSGRFALETHETGLTLLDLLVE